ncbi:hypothetical protein Tco_1043939 [Tanacetum coccineum]|uniref:Uncharacterized protein n=1 Tax=Tanacetum coccineum TaxID=301880 RepID=A0ABQ5GP18_9ASTR
MERVKPSCRITKTSIVFRMDLYRGDNAHTVKRRLLIALSVPVEECSLTFGDMVLKNDIIPSSISTKPETIFIDALRLLAFLQLIGVDPVPVRGGLGGAY